MFSCFLSYLRVGTKVTVMKAKALVGELVDTRTSSGAPRTFAVDLQFNEQVEPLK